jgi:hypothetical protein
MLADHCWNLCLYTYNLILGLLLANVAITLHKSSECKVLSSVKYFVDTATTTSGTWTAAFTAFLALALYVLCLTGIMLLAEEYKSLSSCTKEDKGNCLLSNQFLIPTVAALVMPPAAVALALVEGGDLMGALHFNEDFMIPFLYGLLPIIYHKDGRGHSSLETWLSLQYAACHKFCCVQEHYVLLDKRLFKKYHGFQT